MGGRESECRQGVEFLCGGKSKADDWFLIFFSFFF